MNDFLLSFWQTNSEFFLLAAMVMGVTGVLIGIAWIFSPLMRRLQ